MQCPRADPTRAFRVDRLMASQIRLPLHRLVSRRSPPLRSSRPACRREDRRAGDLSLRARRSRATRCAPHARPLGGAARWWLAQSLRALQASLDAIGAPLVLRKGPAAKVIAELARETGAGAVFWNEIAQAPHQAVADQVAAALQEIGVASQRFPGDLLAAPADIRNKEGRGLRVFTPFWRRVQSLGRSAEAAARAEDAAPGAGPRKRQRSKAGASSPRIRTGPAACARPGRPARHPAQARLDDISRRRRRRLCRRARPARPRRHLAAVAASALRRDQPAAGLARRALCRGRAPCACRATSTNS